MKIFTTLVALVAGLLFVSGAALAGDTDKAFHQIDANQDGVVTQTEASVDSELMDAFAQADANRDGYLTKSEFNSISAMEWEDETEEAE